MTTHFPAANARSAPALENVTVAAPRRPARTCSLPAGSDPSDCSRWATVIPAAWSFMLAARARGLGSVWTTFHLTHEREAAELLGIPYEDVMQAVFILLAKKARSLAKQRNLTGWLFLTTRNVARNAVRGERLLMWVFFLCMLFFAAAIVIVSRRILKIVG